MKKYLIFLALLPVGFGSCVGTTDDVFDKSAAERIDEKLIEYGKILRDNKNGWVVEYWPEAGRAYGGYNLYFLFGDQDRAWVASEVYYDDVEESLYSLKSDMGPTLNFDTYNEILHFFSDPANPYGETGYGFEGDYEFVIMSATPEEVILQGKKTHNMMRMTPLPDGMEWVDYADKLDIVWEDSHAPVFGMVIDGREVNISRQNNTFTIRYEVEQDGVTTTKQITAPFIYTPTGIKFYEPVEIYGVTMQDFTLNKPAERFEGDEADAQINLQYPPINEIFASTRTQWYFDSFSTYLNSYWNSAMKGISKFATLKSAYLGWNDVSTYTGLGLTFIFNYQGSNLGAGYAHTLNAVDNTENQVEIGFTGETFLYGNSLYDYFKNFLTVIADNSPYTLYPDDPYFPSAIYFESVANPEVYFVVLTN